MRILGLAGGLAPQALEDPFSLGKVLFHDAAAALVEDGRIVAAVEEERLNRIKHTNKAPLNAVRACLEQAGIAIGDVDHFAYYADDSALTRALASRGLSRLGGATDFAQALCHTLRSGLGADIHSSRIHFIRHHLAHAASAFRPSGFESSLIFTVDAMGEEDSGLVLEAKGPRLEILRSLPISQSLGFLYADLIRLIGFEYQEEYKVMGLAPYGDPSRFRSGFQRLYELQPQGEYRLYRERIRELTALVPPRGRLDEIGPAHQDFAASLQELLETIVFHLLSHFRAVTGLTRLCLAGGVAQNCSMNGKLLYSGLFERIFVQPAATDAGCALGAALEVYSRQCSAQPLQKLEHVYLGRSLPEPQAVLDEIRPWSAFVTYERLTDPGLKAAELLASGKILGWMQGRSEFGPRALGNRSILADPRPAENRERINAVVKKREAFRPFAPAVLEEAAAEYFDWPEGLAELYYMTFVVRVRPQKQRLLGAVTHVDGTARVQVVARRANEPFWSLISHFGRLTGVPVVLNTSFNNNSEPIVDSVTDGIVCLLTTRLDCIIVGEWLVSPRAPVADPAAFADLVPRLPVHLRIVREGMTTGAGFALTHNADVAARVPVSPGAAGVLAAADAGRTLGELMEGVPEPEAVLAELQGLWERRWVVLLPAGSQAPRGRSP